MHRPTIRLAGRLLVAGVLGLALLAPATVLAADPSGDPVASAPASEQPSDTASEQPTDGTVEVDPSFIASASPTATPVGAVLSATGRPDRTPPPTDSVSQRPTPSSPQGLLILLTVLATICLACARTPDVRRR